MTNEQRAALYGFLISIIGFAAAEEWLHAIVANNDNLGSIKFLNAKNISVGPAAELTGRFLNLTQDDLNQIIEISGWD
ncbi:MAG: hypothetical protein IAF02_15715 [Anaerolineae bacterium]|nr:hypothetical protein [Anaerolineae bacterium]